MIASILDWIREQRNIWKTHPIQNNIIFIFFSSIKKPAVNSQTKEYKSAKLHRYFLPGPINRLFTAVRAGEGHGRMAPGRVLTWLTHDFYTWTPPIG